MTSRHLRNLGRAAAVAIVACAPSLAGAEGLELRRVVLSTGGVAYLEYEAKVEGDATLAFDVRLDQVDDVLKSFVVLDDQGGIGNVSLPGRQPLAEIFRDLPFDAAALASPVALLQALAGEEVEVEGNADVTGRILSVVPETVALADGGTTTRHRLTLATSLGLRQAIVEESTSIRFTDAALEDKVAAALAAIAEHRVEDRRTLTLETTGEAERTVRLGYVIAAPLWKTTYRLALGEGATALLQGWATLENMTGQDWQGVELTLVSGNPVTFRQALYESYWVERPWVPVDVAGRVVPLVDGGAMANLLTKEQEALYERSAEVVGEVAEESAYLIADSTYDPAYAAAPAQLAATGAAASEEAATQVVFRLPEPVTLAAGESLSAPIVSRAVPAERIALYQPATDTRHPLAAVRLTNDGATGLPPGVATIYESTAGGEAFVGDARLGALPAGEERMVAFALDQRTLVDREDRFDEAIATARIDRGVLHVTVMQRQSTLYGVKAPEGEALQVLIEHPRQPGWELAAPTGDVETTETDYRLPLAVPAGTTATLEVVLELPREESAQLVDLGYEQVFWYAENGAMPEEMRVAFRRIAELRGALDEVDRAIADTQQRRDLALEEQERLRDNLASVPSGSDLAGRYLTKLAEQEDAIEAQLLHADELHAERERSLGALQDYIAGLEM